MYLDANYLEDALDELTEILEAVNHKTATEAELRQAVADALGVIEQAQEEEEETEEEDEDEDGDEEEEDEAEESDPAEVEV